MPRTTPLAVVLWAVIASCGKTQHNDGAAVAARTVLARFDTPPTAFELSIGEAVAGRYPLSLLLIDGQNRVLASAPLPVAAYTQRSRKERVDPLWGADPGSEAVALGEEGEYVGIAAKAIRIAPGKAALLITQRYGFDHLKRQHVLYEAEAGKLNKVWSEEEGAGPTWSAVRVIPSPNSGIDDFAYFDGFLDPSNEQAGRIRITRLHWDGSATLQKTALPDQSASLFVLNAGVFGSVANARKTRAADSGCLSGLMVLGSEDYPKLFAGKALLGMVYTQRAEAEFAQDNLAKCTGRAKPLVVEYGGPGKR